jgi:hypothetical protein
MLVKKGSDMFNPTEKWRQKTTEGAIEALLI